jgi:hypothetical protein
VNQLSMVNINSNHLPMGRDMLEPHIKYLYGRLNNLVCQINHSQHHAKISSCTVFNSNAMKRVSVRPDGLFCVPCAPPARTIESPSLILVINDTKLLMPLYQVNWVRRSNTCDEGTRSMVVMAIRLQVHKDKDDGEHAHRWWTRNEMIKAKV